MTTGRLSENLNQVNPMINLPISINNTVALKGSLKIFFILLCIIASTLAQAKDLYVATDGNDSTSYTENNINKPWLTFSHALYNLKAGDTLYVRGGTYTPQYPLWLYSDYHNQTKGGDPNEVMNSETGTASNPVIIENYPNETPIINLQYVDTYINLDNKSYWTFRGLTFINSGQVFKVAQDAESFHNTFDKLTIKATKGGDNYGAIHVQAIRGDYTTITNSDIEGPGQDVHQNTAAIYINRVNHLKILNNKISNAPIGIYFKHVNEVTSASSTDIEVAYNYFEDHGRTSLEWNGRFGKIHDNIFGPNTAAASINNSNGGAGGDYNIITHNTFIDGAIFLGGKSESSDIFPGALGNTITDNIFHSPLEIHRYSSLPDETVLARNIYPTHASIIFGVNSSTLPVDSSSIIGAPTYISGHTPDSLSGYALSNESIGAGDGINNSNLGADIITLVANHTEYTPIPTPTLPPSPTPGITENECDNWQTNRSDWLWCDSFEDTSALSNRYEDVNLDGISFTTSEAANGATSIEQRYTTGQVDAGWLIKLKPEGYPDHIFYRWYHKFEAGMTEFPPKMARIGYRNRSTWKSIFMIHTWMSNTKPSLDVLAENSTQGPWLPVAVSDFDLVQHDGEWASYEVEVKLNTPGSNDGHYRLWINDTIVAERTNVDLRGNTNDKINEVMLDNYWNGGAPHASARYFDNFVISTKRIGSLDYSPTYKALPPGNFRGQ